MWHPSFFLGSLPRSIGFCVIVAVLGRFLHCSRVSSPSARFQLRRGCPTSLTANTARLQRFAIHARHFQFPYSRRCGIMRWCVGLFVAAKANLPGGSQWPSAMATRDVSISDVATVIAIGPVCFALLLFLTPNIEMSRTEAQISQAYFDVCEIRQSLAREPQVRIRALTKRDSWGTALSARSARRGPHPRRIVWPEQAQSTPGRRR